MKKQNRFTQTIVGLLLGLLFAQASFAQVPGPQPVVVVKDGPAAIKGLFEQTKQTLHQAKIISSSELTRMEQLSEHAKNAQRWLTTVNQYTRVIMEDVRRFTSLKGILELGEERLGLDDDTLKALADIGQTIRACFALKEQFETLIHTRLQMIQSMYVRAKKGIFNPAQDLDDLDSYLRSGIGRSSERKIASRERLARLDNELETWIYDLQQARKELAAKQAELNQIIEKLKAEGGLSSSIRQRTVSDNGNRSGPRLHRRENQSGEAISSMLVNKNLIEGQINDLNQRIADLLEKINARYKSYHQVFDEAKVKVSVYRRAVEGWEGMIESKEKAIQDMVNPYYAPRPTEP